MADREPGERCSVNREIYCALLLITTKGVHTGDATELDAFVGPAHGSVGVVGHGSVEAGLVAVEDKR